MLVLMVTYVISAATGVERSIKFLSQTNMNPASLVLLIILFFGPLTQCLFMLGLTIASFLLAILLLLHLGWDRCLCGHHWCGWFPCENACSPTLKWEFVFSLKNAWQLLVKPHRFIQHHHLCC